MSGMKLLSRAQIKSLKNAIDSDFFYEYGQIPGGSDDAEENGKMMEALRACEDLYNRRLETLKLIRSQQDWIRNSMQIAKSLDL